MSSTHFFRFSADDDPTQLSKVGNWVITFLDSAENTPIRLAITHVIPRQVSNDLQLRSLYIQRAEHQYEWQIIKLEYFDSRTQQMLEADLDTTLAHKFVQQLIGEFARYDVELSYV